LARSALQLPREQWRVLWAARMGRVLLVSAMVLLAGTIAGMVALWPGSSGDVSTGPGTRTESAKVVTTTTLSCATGQCRTVEIEILSGADKGRDAVVSLNAREGAAHYAVGDRVRVLANERQGGVAATDSSTPPPDLPGARPGAKPLAQFSYSIVDFDRLRPIALLAGLFALLVILAGRLRGLLSLVGLGAGILAVSQFVVPAMVAHESPLLVALVGSLAAMFLTITLTSGLSAQSLAASLGIAASLLLAALLGLFYVHFAHLNGSGSDLAFTLKSTNPGLSLQGLVLAGFVIGALGVLADMAVTQASAVMALRRANPELSRRAVYREALTVGRDHLAATVNTLVFAYVGASLPLLLLFKTAGVSFDDALNNQDVAESVVATLVGAIGILASVPLTTGLATLLATDIPADEIPVDAHGHHHH
jgi:uncharacterized membrane protein